MKKIKWAVVLAAVVAIMFAGCTGPFDDDVYVANPVGAGLKYLKVTGRTANYFGVDILESLADDDDIIIYVSGAKGIQIGSQNNPWGTVIGNDKAEKGPAGCLIFTIPAGTKGNTDNFRIQADVGADFNIYEIITSEFTLTEVLEDAPKGYVFSEDEFNDNPCLRMAGTPKITVGQ